MKSEVERRMPYINVFTSDDGVNKDTPTVTSSVLYWGNTKRCKQDILQSRVMCMKIKQGVEISRERYA